MLNDGKLYDAIDSARKAVKEYPLNHELQYHLVQALCTACSEQTPEYKENIEKYKGEILAFGEKAGNKIQLVGLYSKWGMKEEAVKILDSMPAEIWDARELWNGCLLEGEEWKENQENTMMRVMVLLHHLVGEYTPKSDWSPLQKIECGKAVKKICSLIGFDEDDMAEDSVGCAFDNVSTAKLYCEAGDIANAIEHVEKATQASMYHIEQMDKTNEDGSNYYAWSTPRNLPWIIWEDHLAKPEFDIIRDEKRFIKCFESLKAQSREQK